MATKPTTSRRQRLLRTTLLAGSLVAFSYPLLNTAQGTPGSELWRGLGWVCAMGSVMAFVWWVRILRLPDDHLRYWEPDPTSNPATRNLRASAFSVLAVVGVAALAGALGGYGFDGATWWRSVLVSIAWPTLAFGVIGLILVLREGRAPATPLHAEHSQRRLGN